jgi:3-hydroxyisobutyrate dehydrogenase-like beta-hydroxyacid dehydrogenase
MLYPPVPISFLGTGLMGKPMAMNLIKSGYQVTVWNRTPSKAAELMSAGARLGKSPADAVRNAVAVIMMLENGAVVTDLLFTQGVADACRDMGNVTRVGPRGRGQLCKLVNQCIVAVTIGAVAEGLTLAKAGGADPAQVRRAITGGFCDSRILELHGQRMIDRNFVPGGFIKNQLKDLNAALQVAGDLGLRLPLTTRVRELFAALADSGKGELDHSALILQIESMGQ